MGIYTGSQSSSFKILTLIEQACHVFKIFLTSIMRILSLLACGLVHFAVTGAVAHGNMQRTYYPFRELNGTSIVESVSQKGQLDGPKLHPGANETVFDW